MRLSSSRLQSSPLPSGRLPSSRPFGVVGDDGEAKRLFDADKGCQRDVHRQVRLHARPGPGASSLGLRADQFDKRAGSSLRQSPGIVGAFAPHDRREGGVEQRRGLIREPAGDAHARSRLGKSHVFFSRLGFFVLDSGSGILLKSPSLDTSFELTRGALARPSDELPFDALAELAFQYGGRKDPAHDIHMLGKHFAVLQSG